MRNNRVISFLLVSLAIAAGFAAPPTAPSAYATISYAEGKSFSIIRNNQTREWPVSDKQVFGMEILPGDIIHTSGSTFLELSIKPIKAVIQIAENTSYRCDIDASGTKSSGELYYGRVRAKVAKLTGSSSFKISSPSLVAGVRGTDFGCDVIAARKTNEPVLQRVFCFEGSVAVSNDKTSEAEPVLIGGSEMVETRFETQPTTDAAAIAAPPAIKKTALSDEVRTFWAEHPVTSKDLPAEVKVTKEGDLTITEKVWPEGYDPEREKHNLSVIRGNVLGLVAIGTAICLTAVIVSSQTGYTGDMLPYYSAGGILIGSGTILGLMTSAFE